ncbi:Flavodoxin domain [Corynebacterium mustelae]|uniref:Flavodoxin domain n=1 Tax=Corynebacterium mustelae TaxID=571915 RepID=A0A0G3GY32_9CORY|nr:flavodoxin domain-containing protein [Corynebacterium mustelae]AKK05445.1 Flavodoxin domain [Corynebacterium mustelae]
MATVYIRYKSAYSSTRHYAERLAELLGTEAYDLSIPVPDDGEPVVVLSYVHGPKIPAATCVSELHARASAPRPLAAVAVGMTPIDVAEEKDQLLELVPAECARFYLSGDLIYSTMQAKHKAIMTSIVTALRFKPKRNQGEQNIVDSYNVDTRTMDFAQLAPIVEWATRR